MHRYCIRLRVLSACRYSVIHTAAPACHVFPAALYHLDAIDCRNDIHHRRDRRALALQCHLESSRIIRRGCLQPFNEPSGSGPVLCELCVPFTVCPFTTYRYARMRSVCGYIDAEPQRRLCRYGAFLVLPCVPCADREWRRDRRRHPLA